MPKVSLREITAETVREEPSAAPQVGIWRFMIDAEYQGQGIGAEALRQVIDHVRAKAIARTLEVSYVPGPGCPEPFYLRAGFRHTGREDAGEIVLELVHETPAVAGTRGNQ